MFSCFSDSFSTNMKYILSLFFLVSLINIASAQSSFLPHNLGDGVNTTYSEINPVLSPNGKTLYFSRINDPKNKFGEKKSQDVWYSEKQADGTWGEAKRCSDNINRGRYNSLFAVWNDGESALVNGRYKRMNSGEDFWLSRGFSVTSKNPTGDWTVPQYVKMKGFKSACKSRFLSASVSQDGKFMLLSFSRRFNGKKSNLYVSLKNVKGWSRPKKLKKPIKTPAQEITPFLLADNSKMYFSRTNKGKKGSTDIYTSQRTDDSFRRWTAPVKLSDTINSTKFDAYFITNAKGSYGYWASNNQVKGGTDIFGIKIFEEYPYARVHLKVLSAINKKPFAYGINPLVGVNHLVSDTTHYDKETGEMVLTLPLGTYHEFSLEMAKFKTEPLSIDLAGQREFVEFDTVLYFIPDTMVTVSGKTLLDGKIKLSQNNPEIWVNGKLFPNTAFNKEMGSYSLKLPAGKNYKIQLKQTGYTSKSDSVYLAKYILADSVTKDLRIYTEQHYMAKVKGRILNKKDGQPIVKSGHQNLIFLVNGQPTAANHYDSLTSEYHFEFEYGNTYTLNAHKDNFFPQFEMFDFKTKRKKDTTVIKDLYLVPIEVGQVVKLNNIFFETGKATLKAASFPELDKVVTFLHDNPSVKIEIDGHTDNVGKKAANMKLSTSRAKSVETYLEKKGININNVTSKGFGDTKPVTSNATKAGKAQNRRVEFVIKGK